MLNEVIVVQANTVEEATQQALDSLGISRDEAKVEVLVRPSRRLMGLRRVLAEVQVTKIEQSPAIKEEKAIFDGEALSPTEQNGVRVHQSELDFRFDGEPYPTVEVDEGIVLCVNGEVQHESVTIRPDDIVTLEVLDEGIPPHFSIQLTEQDMIALLTFTPGEKITRTLADTKFTQNLKVIPQEETAYYNDLDPQEIVEQLKKMGVQQGIVFSEINQVVNAEKPCEFIVARGVSPVEGNDGSLEVAVGGDEFDPAGLERIDYREMNKIANSQKGDVIATHILPVEGTAGWNLRGKTIPVSPVRDITIRLGENVELVGDQIISQISGNPSIKWHDRIVKVDVNPVYHHPEDVDLESGNIRSEGDVRIAGNVRSSMFVGATGSIHIGGAVRHATVEALKSVVIQNNVLSSMITVGQQRTVENEYFNRLEQLVKLLKQIKTAIEQVLVIRGTPKDELASAEIKQLVYLLLEEKYSNFAKLNKDFIQFIRENENALTEEWRAIADQFHVIFAAPTHEETLLMNHLYEVIHEATALVDAYRIEASTKEQLVVPYAVNSTLYSSGDIQVVADGVFQCKLTAENNITVKGVCRGGEVIAQNHITLDETGSESPVKTLIQTSSTGWIKIGKAYAGTEIQIGNRRYSFMKDGYDIHARLNKDGELLL